MSTAVEPTLATKAKLFRGLGDSSRLAILEILRGGPRSVSEIVDATGLMQSNVSNHLACLLDCNLVVREQRGRFAYYELADKHVAKLLATASRLLSEVAHGVHACGRYESDVR